MRLPVQLLARLHTSICRSGAGSVMNHISSIHPTLLTTLGAPSPKLPAALVHETIQPTRNPARIGWDHSSIDDALRYRTRAGAKSLVTFHHDLTHSDSTLEKTLEAAHLAHRPDFEPSIATEKQEFTL